MVIEAQTRMDCSNTKKDSHTCFLRITNWNLNNPAVPHKWKVDSLVGLQTFGMHAYSIDAGSNDLEITNDL